MATVQNTQKARKPLGIIQTVGVSLEPVKFTLQKALAKGRETFVFFVATDTSASFARQAASVAKLDADHFVVTEVPDSPSEIGRVVQRCEEGIGWLLERGVAQKQIVADPTCGRKWMSAGVCIYASNIGLKLCYVDVPYRGGKAISGKSKLVELGNPFDQTGFLHLERIRFLYNAGNFLEAASACNNLAQKSSSLKALGLALQQLCIPLHEWDQFAHLGRSLTPKFEKALACLRESPYVMGDKTWSRFLEQVEGLSRKIDEVRESVKGLKPSKLLIVDLCANGWRRYHRKLYDDSFVRFQRAMEVMADFHLMEGFGFNCHKPDFDVFKGDQWDLVDKAYASAFPKNPVAVFECWKILHTLRCPEAEWVFYKNGQYRFQKERDARNKSILAHGFEPVSDKVVEQFGKVIEDAADRVAGFGSAYFAVPEMPPFPVKTADG